MKQGIELIQRLREDLELLASNASAQIARVRTADVDNDELALAFYDTFTMIGSLKEAGYLTERQVALVTELDHQLARMSGQENAVLWTDDAVRTAPEWRTVRKLAGDALRELTDRRRGSDLECADT